MYLTRRDGIYYLCKRALIDRMASMASERSCAALASRTGPSTAHESIALVPAR